MWHVFMRRSAEAGWCVYTGRKPATVSRPATPRHDFTTSRTVPLYSCVCLRPCTCNQKFYEYLIKTNECIFHGDTDQKGQAGSQASRQAGSPSSTSTSGELHLVPRGAVGCQEDNCDRVPTTSAVTTARAERNSEEFGEPESAHTSAGGGCSQRLVWLFFVLPKQTNNS